ncbi:sigma factor-like helix-turn-helix DNA-binding protein [Flavisphingomonas formosensis]|uniref:sigma factor-like helix-turn-helix DNA-binding protein n=1 Tax=Flavisphingomonas formosensis TaxID=861534 RepID=UPI0012F9FF9A|nr:sigma factor-like helix-turn-helix DNA-binding protein [Sphingomonas formosensis]
MADAPLRALLAHAISVLEHMLRLARGSRWLASRLDVTDRPVIEHGRSCGDDRREGIHQAPACGLKIAAGSRTPDGEVGADDHVDLERYRRCLERLPRRTLAVFILHRVHGLSFDETSVRLRISKRAVRRHFRRAVYRVSRNL